MNKNFKGVLIALVVIAALYFLYHLLFIRVVNYEIAGIKIPSVYNAFTGKVKPIANYHGKVINRTVQSRQNKKIGLSDEQVAVAQLRWAIFEEWANAHPEYKGWDQDPQIFKNANDEFKKELKGRVIKVVA